MRKTAAERVNGDELRPEYDLTKLKFVGRGIYAKRYRSGTNLVLLDRDVRRAFPDDESVNEALRIIAKAAKRQASCKKVSCPSTSLAFATSGLE